MSLEPAAPEGTSATAPKPKLLDRLRAACRVRHYSLRTEEAYAAWGVRFIRFHRLRHPLEMGAGEINAFLTHLAVEGHVSASTQNQAFSAILFLYQKVLEVDPGRIAKRPRRLPVVLSREEVRRTLGQMEGTYRLIALLLYGAGLRLMECLRLRVQDLDWQRGEILVRHGKEGHFTISVMENRLNKEKKFLPVSYVVNSWDGKAALTSSASYHHTWERVGAFDLPATILVVTARSRVLSEEPPQEARSLKLSKYELLK